MWRPSSHSNSCPSRWRGDCTTPILWPYCTKSLLHAQVQGLRKAFSTLSDVLIEEVDVIRSEAAERNGEVQKQLAAQAKGLKGVRGSTPPRAGRNAPLTRSLRAGSHGAGAAENRDSECALNRASQGHLIGGAT